MADLTVVLIFLVPILGLFIYRIAQKPDQALHKLDSELKDMLATNDFREFNVSAGGKAGEVIARLNQVISRMHDEIEILRADNEDAEVAGSVISYEKARTEAVIDNMSDGVMVTDSLGSMILINRAMAFMMDCQGQDVKGQFVKDCIAIKEMKDFVEEVHQGGSLYTQKSIDLSLEKSGAESVVNVSCQPLMNSDDSVLGNIYIARDITEARKAQQNQSEFIAHVSHELRTPLNTIKSYVEMLTDDEVSDRETRAEFFNTINDETNRLARLIGNLLNISKIEMGSLSVHKDLVKTGDFFKDLLNSVESQAVSKGIALKRIMPDKLSSLVVDKDMLRVAILNIVGNAIKYTPDGGSVEFRVEENESEMKIDIRDTGHGIAENELPRIFDKFFRSADEKIRARTGNGLGLALSRDVVRLHDGEVAVSSSVGEGTHFTVTLPREDNARVSNYDRNFSSLTESK